MRTSKDQGCCAPPRSPKAAWGAFVPAIAAILAPKCPLCLAGYLSLVGLGSGAATFAAPLLRPLGLALALVAAAVIVVGLGRRARLSAR